MARTLFLFGLILVILGALTLFLFHKEDEQEVVPEPAPVTVDPGWATHSDDMLSFRYPAELGMTYIHAVDWPPAVTITDSAPACAEPVAINGRSYCVAATTEGAAGSIYTDYAYATAREGRTVTLSFTLRTPQCANYGEPQQTACRAEQESFDTDVLADRILETVTLN